MAEMNVTIDRLNEVNWATWKFRMELVLMKDNLWTTVKDEKPEEVTSVWTRNDERARAAIGLSLEDSQLVHIIGATCAKEMWDKLKGYHERGSLSNKIHVLKKLCSMRLTDDGSMSDHLVHASELVHRLASLGEPLKEYLVVAILLSSLPEVYSPLVTALEGRPEEDLKLDYVKGKLLDEWRKRCEGRIGEKVKQETAMIAAVRPEGMGRIVRKCYHCKRKGHLRRNCHALLMQRSKHQNQVSQSGPGSSSSREGVCFAVTAGTDVSMNGRWIIDSSSSEHMTGSTVSFEDMTFCQRRVSFTNRKTMTVRGVGQGRINGAELAGNAVDVKLNGLLYVPGMSGGVLSVSQITSSGYGVLFGTKDCRILKGNEVMLIGDRIDGQYYLRQPVLT